MFFIQADRLGSKKFIWNKFHKKWIGVSYAEVSSQVQNLASGLLARGIDKGDRIVFVLENSLEWVIADLAIMAIGGISVPAFINNTEDDHLHILNDCGAAAVICSTRKLADKIQGAAERSTTCRLMVMIDESQTVHQPTGLTIITWDRIMEDGRQYPANVRKRSMSAKSKDVACLIYTSGLDSAPKGVMLTHSSILHNVYGAHERFSDLSLKDEVFLSILPLSHAYEHTTGLYLPIYLGAEIYHFKPPDQLAQTLREVRPTVMTAVPRLCELMHDRILGNINLTAPMMQNLVALILEHAHMKESDNQLPFWSHLFVLLFGPFVKKRINNVFGGRLKLMVSGGAALPPNVGRFFVALGVPLIQGYGLTEAAPVISVSPIQDNRITTVGIPLKGVKVKLNKSGELLVKGGLVMKGYWNQPQETARVIKKGWLNTGDLAEIDKDGFITITGRSKDIIVNSGGENISPVRVETRLEGQPNIAQAMVDGDRRPWLAAVIVPSNDCISQSLGQRDKMVALIQNDINTANARLTTSERIRKFAIAEDGFTTENKRLTQTLKLRRHIIRRDFRNQIDRLYINTTK
jgi:long-chain acyl-CoA synthetase